MHIAEINKFSKEISTNILFYFSAENFLRNVYVAKYNHHKTPDSRIRLLAGCCCCCWFVCVAFGEWVVFFRCCLKFILCSLTSMWLYFRHNVLLLVIRCQEGRTHRIYIQTYIYEMLELSLLLMFNLLNWWSVWMCPVHAHHERVYRWNRKRNNKI